MSDQKLIQEYFDAWIAHDGAAVQSLFTADGTYRDPSTGGPLSGDDIAAYVHQLCDVFPDLTFELVSQERTSTGLIAVPWILFGTQYGDLGELKATGKSVTLAGCDFIAIEGGQIQSVIGVFDPDHLNEQLD